MKDISEFLSSLWGLPGAVLTTLLCVAVGYALKRFKRYPNDAIPLTIMLLGAGINTLLADPMTPPLTMRLWLGKNMVIGFIAGAGAWLTHKMILKKIESMFGKANGDTDPPFPKADGSNVKPDHEASF